MSEVPKRLKKLSIFKYDLDTNNAYSLMKDVRLQLWTVVYNKTTVYVFEQVCVALVQIIY